MVQFRRLSAGNYIGTCRGATYRVWHDGKAWHMSRDDVEPDSSPWRLRANAVEAANSQAARQESDVRD